MITLSPATLRRLRKIKQSPVIWEGARCSITEEPKRQKLANVISLRIEPSDQPECVLWVDATSGVIRMMEMVEPASGNEVMVRSLIQAIEAPQSNLPPLRPHKIVVNDRQIQFYMRGILQELDITVEFAEQLPLIEEILYNFIEQTTNTPDPIPLELAPQLYAKTNALWNLSPWQYFNDNNILEVKLDRWDVSSFYVTFMGSMGLEFGVIFYHNLESIKTFHMNALQQEEERMQDAFLRQNCMFVLFNSEEEINEMRKSIINSLGWESKSRYPFFGVLHPLEVSRSFLDEEETKALIAAIDSLVAFLHVHRKKFRYGKFPDISFTHILDQDREQIPIVVRTLVGASQDLVNMTLGNQSLVNNYLVPDNTLMRFTYLEKENLQLFKKHAQHLILSDPPMVFKLEQQPIFILQNSKSLITCLIESLIEEEGLRGITFAPAKYDDGDMYELGLLVTGNGRLHLFHEFYHQWELNDIREDWKQKCRSNGNKCVIILAMGIRGKTKGNPRPSHVLGYYEIDFVPFTELGLGLLRSSDLG